MTKDDARQKSSPYTPPFLEILLDKGEMLSVFLRGCVLVSPSVCFAFSQNSHCLWVVFTEGFLGTSFGLDILVLFGGVLPMVLHICWAFCSRKCSGKILFFLGLVFVTHFRERTFVFVVFLLPCAFRWCFAYVFAYLLGFLFPKMLGKNSLLLRFGF